MAIVKTNPDKDIVKEIRRKLKETDGYCPCRISRTEDTKCMCKEFLEMKSGMCHCGLYIKYENKYKSKYEVDYYCNNSIMFDD